ncbi:DUF4362 domain-containing protein [Halalkalibacter urbisdiaboli]|uniref:DUF4362 domain-containing protein n=1 Tax=Halalkalibacter urbisdiaboli TaxID=1960589 RepID=UPI000B4325F8|nr:DUF4362 domain-containing protein [Halalkalibacter urbisdiaboli]
MKTIKVRVVLLLVLMVGCQTTETSPIKMKQAQKNVQEYIPSSADVVDKHGEINNIQRFIEFLDKVKLGQKDNIRVVKYTTEGDPMLQDLEYDGKVIKSTTDTRRDQFGVGSINTTTCASIEVIETSERTDYILEGCETIIDNTILVTWK